MPGGVFTLQIAWLEPIPHQNVQTGTVAIIGVYTLDINIKPTTITAFSF